MAIWSICRRQWRSGLRDTKAWRFGALKYQRPSWNESPVSDLAADGREVDGDVKDICNNARVTGSILEYKTEFVILGTSPAQRPFTYLSAYLAAIFVRKYAYSVCGEGNNIICSQLLPEVVLLEVFAVAYGLVPPHLQSADAPSKTTKLLDLYGHLLFTMKAKNFVRDWRPETICRFFGAFDGAKLIKGQAFS